MDCLTRSAAPAWAASPQLPEETYQRMKDYLKRHQVKQKDFVTRLMAARLEKEDSSIAEDSNG